MTPAQPSEAQRLKRCREIFETAMAEGISMSAARDRVAQQRWAEIAARRDAQCGTRAPASATDTEAHTPPRWMMAE